MYSFVNKNTLFSLGFRKINSFNTNLRFFPRHMAQTMAKTCNRLWGFVFIPSFDISTAIRCKPTESCYDLLAAQGPNKFKKAETGHITGLGWLR